MDVSIMSWGLVLRHKEIENCVIKKISPPVVTKIREFHIFHILYEKVLGMLQGCSEHIPLFFENAPSMF